MTVTVRKGTLTSCPCAKHQGTVDLMSQLDASQPDELETRAKLIDQQLSRAGWSKNKRNLIAEFVLKALNRNPFYW